MTLRILHSLWFFTAGDGFMDQQSDQPEIAPTEAATSGTPLLEKIWEAIQDIRSQLAGQAKSHYTVKEVAEIVKWKPYTVREWIRARRINAIRIEGTGPRGRLLIPRAELDRLLTQGFGANIPDTVMGDGADHPGTA
jgi:excisionase family DNA binding protein